MDKTIKVGDSVRTPRFLNVKIEQVFTSERAMRESGFTETTHFDDPDCPYRVNGKSIGLNHMVFAAAPKDVII